MKWVIVFWIIGIFPDGELGGREYQMVMFGPFGVGVGRSQRAGGGIAKLAGVDDGPPPKSGPNPQGLSYLMKRGKNT